MSPYKIQNDEFDEYEKKRFFEVNYCRPRMIFRDRINTVLIILMNYRVDGVTNEYHNLRRLNNANRWKDVESFIHKFIQRIYSDVAFRTEHMDKVSLDKLVNDYHDKFNILKEMNE
jgi:hypothetical protein